MAHFDVEDDSVCDYDRVTVNGIDYCNDNQVGGGTGLLTEGPEGVAVASAATITWTADSSVRHTGFAICGACPAACLDCMPWRLPPLTHQQLTRGGARARSDHGI